MLLKKSIPFWFLFRRVWKDVFIVLVFSFIFIGVKRWSGIDKLAVPIAVPGILGTLISLLLAFRTNQSYDRWWEARKVWGAIVNDSRNLIRQLDAYISRNTMDMEGQKALRLFAMRQIAWCYALADKLRGNDHHQILRQHLPEHEQEFAARADNIPNALLQLHSRHLGEVYHKGLITDRQQIQVDETLRRLTDAMGMCERIKGTVFPRTYSLFLYYLIYFFIFLLPFGMIEVSDVEEIIIVTLTASFFFLIEKTAVQLQDPFENHPYDTAMTTISRNIEINLRQMVGDENVPEKLAPHRFYAL